MPHRRILDITKVDFSKISGFDVGEVVTVTIAQVPNKYLEKVYIAIPVCPICREPTNDENDRIVVSVNPTFTNISNLGYGSNAHRKCFDDCPLIDEPTPVPW